MGESPLATAKANNIRIKTSEVRNILLLISSESIQCESVILAHVISTSLLVLFHTVYFQVKQGPYVKVSVTLGPMSFNIMIKINIQLISATHVVSPCLVISHDARIGCLLLL